MKTLVLAIDSSLTCPGYAVLEFDLAAKTVKVLEVSHVKTVPKNTTGHRLNQIADHIQGILNRYDFDDVVFEKGLNKFKIATFQIQRTVGVSLHTLFKSGYATYEEVDPKVVKKIVSGNGSATKEVVAAALPKFVGPIAYKNYDESDAVAVGIAYGIQKNWL